MTTRSQAIRLAIIIEALSLPVLFIRTYRDFSELLGKWFVTLNFPTSWLFQGSIFVGHRLKIVSPPVGFLIVAIQLVIWFVLWLGLLTIFRKIKSQGKWYGLFAILLLVDLMVYKKLNSPPQPDPLFITRMTRAQVLSEATAKVRPGKNCSQFSVIYSNDYWTVFYESNGIPEVFQIQDSDGKIFQVVPP
jgi:hypothetical protein